VLSDRSLLKKVLVIKQSSPSFYSTPKTTPNANLSNSSFVSTARSYNLAQKVQKKSKPFLEDFAVINNDVIYERDYKVVKEKVHRILNY
jgi:hypothetical protein